MGRIRGDRVTCMIQFKKVLALDRQTVTQFVYTTASRHVALGAFELCYELKLAANFERT